jgi:ankyrin repeat protein
MGDQPSKSKAPPSPAGDFLQRQQQRALNNNSSNSNEINEYGEEILSSSASSAALENAPEPRDELAADLALLLRSVEEQEEEEGGNQYYRERDKESDRGDAASSESPRRSRSVDMSVGLGTAAAASENRSASATGSFWTPATDILQHQQQQQQMGDERSGNASEKSEKGERDKPPNVFQVLAHAVDKVVSQTAQKQSSSSSQPSSYSSSAMAIDASDLYMSTSPPSSSSPAHGFMSPQPRSPRGSFSSPPGGLLGSAEFDVEDGPGGSIVLPPSTLVLAETAAAALAMRNAKPGLGHAKEKMRYFGGKVCAAAALDNIETLSKLLVRKGSAQAHHKRNFAGWTPIHWASARGNNRCVQLLLERDRAFGDSNQQQSGQVSALVRTNEGLTPLQLAIIGGHLSTASLLLDSFPGPAHQIRALNEPMERNPGIMVENSPRERYGAFIWRIHSFSEIFARRIYSEVFAVAGCNWRLVCYPAGSKDDGHLSVYVEAVQGSGADNDADWPSETWSLTANVVFAVRNQLDDSSRIGIRTVREHRFSRRHLDLGFAQLVKKTTLANKKSGCLRNDTLMIEVTIDAVPQSNFGFDDRSGVCTWKLDNLSRRQDGENVTSPSMWVAGGQWQLSAYPRGKRADSTSMAVYLRCADRRRLPTHAMLLNFELSVLNQLTGKKFTRRAEMRSFRHKVEDWGFPNFMPLEELYDAFAGFAQHDSIVFEARIEMLGPIAVEDDFLGFDKLQDALQLSQYMSQRAISGPSVMDDAQHGAVSGKTERRERATSPTRVSRTSRRARSPSKQQKKQKGRSDKGKSGAPLTPKNLAKNVGRHTKVVGRQTKVVMKRALSADYSGHVRESKLERTDPVESSLTQAINERIDGSEPSASGVSATSDNYSLDPIGPNDGLFTPLHWAVYCRSLEGVEQLAQRGCNLNARDSQGRTPLTWAAQMGDSAVVELLLAYRADGTESGGSATEVDALDFSGFCPLHHAVFSGHLQCVRLLVSAGADAERVVHDHEPECARRIVAIRRRDPSIGDAEPAVACARCHSLECSCPVALDCSCDHQCQAWDYCASPLEMAIKAGFLEIAVFLVEHVVELGKPSPTAVDVMGRNPFHWCAFAGPDLTEMVDDQSDSGRHREEESDRRVNRKDENDTDDTILDLDEDEKGEDEDDDAKEPPNETNDLFNRLVSLLFDAGFDAGAPDFFGNTPLHNAVWRGHVNFASALLKRGVDSSGARLGGSAAADNGQTPLHLSVLANDVDCINLLLKHNVDVDARDALGLTPLQLAMRCAFVEPLCEALVDAGADLSVAHNAPLHVVNATASADGSDLLSDDSESSSAEDSRDLVWNRRSESTTWGTTEVDEADAAAAAMTPLELAMLNGDVAGAIYLLELDAVVNTGRLLQFLAAERKVLAATVKSESHTGSPQTPSARTATLLRTSVMNPTFDSTSREGLVRSSSRGNIDGLVRSPSRGHLSFHDPESLLRSDETQLLVGKIDLPQSSLGRDLLGLVDNPTFADVCFRMVDDVGDDEQVPGVHAMRGIICARCDYFAALLVHSGMKEATSHTDKGGLQYVDIPNMSARTMRNVVEYLFTDEVPLAVRFPTLAVEPKRRSSVSSFAEARQSPETVETLLQLLAAADRFMISRLKVHCEVLLADQLNDGNVPRIFKRADFHNAGVLLRACVRYVALHASELNVQLSAGKLSRLHKMVQTPSFRQCTIELLRRVEDS